MDEQSRTADKHYSFELLRNATARCGGLFRLENRTEPVQSGVVMRTSVDLDPSLVRELKAAQSVTHEKQATIIRQAIRLGLPLVVNRFQAPRPEGYFASDYPLPKDRVELEAAMAKVKQRPDR